MLHLLQVDCSRLFRNIALAFYFASLSTSFASRSSQSFFESVISTRQQSRAVFQQDPLRLQTSFFYCPSSLAVREPNSTFENLRRRPFFDPSYPASSVYLLAKMKFLKSAHTAAATTLLISAGLPKDLNINDASKPAIAPSPPHRNKLTWINSLDPERLKNHCRWCNVVLSWGR